MQQHIDTTRRHLGELAAMQAQVEHDEREILQRARKRLAAVEQDLKALRLGGRLHEAEASRQYQALVLERGKLHQVIAGAQEALRGT